MKTGTSFTAVPVKFLIPVIGDAVPSEILVLTVKLLLKSCVGVKITPASNVLTSAVAPVAVQIPVLETKVDVTKFDVATLKLPATVFDKVNVAVTVALSTSVITISVRFSAVSSM